MVQFIQRLSFELSMVPGWVNHKIQMWPLRIKFWWSSRQRRIAIQKLLKKNEEAMKWVTEAIARCDRQLESINQLRK